MQTGFDEPLLGVGSGPMYIPHDSCDLAPYEVGWFLTSGKGASQCFSVSFWTGPQYNKITYLGVWWLIIVIWKTASDASPTDFYTYNQHRHRQFFIWIKWHFIADVYLLETVEIPIIFCFMVHYIHDACVAECTLYPGPWFNIKMSSCQYRKSHCWDKTILRPSYLHNGISYTGKTAYLYWIGPQDHIVRHGSTGLRMMMNLTKLGWKYAEPMNFSFRVLRSLISCAANDV